MKIARQFVLFSLIGCTQFAVDTAVLIALTHADVPVTTANLISRATATVLGLLLNFSITFRRGGAGGIGAGIVARHFVSWVALTLASTALVTQLYGLRPESTTPANWLAVVKVAVEGMLFIVSFLIARHWVFRVPPAR